MSIISFASCFVRYIVEGIFCYKLYNYENDINYTNMVKFVSLYTLVLGIYMCILHEVATLRIVSVILVLFCFLFLENKKNNNIKNNFFYIMSFSIFVNFMAEFSHFFGYLINGYFWDFIKIYKFHENDYIEFTLYRTMFLVLHILILFTIYKLKLVKSKDIKIISMVKIIPLIFGACLLMVVYLKNMHHNSEYRSDIDQLLLNILTFMLPTYLGFYHAFSMVSEFKNMKSNNTEDLNIETKIENPLLCKVFNLNEYLCGIKPCAAKYEYDKITFKRILRRFNIDERFKGFTQLVFCLILTKRCLRYTRGWEIEKDVINVMANLICKSPFEIRKNIQIIIEKTWVLEDINIIRNEYSNGEITKYNKIPTVDEFLITLAKSTTSNDIYKLNQELYI